MHEHDSSKAWYEAVPHTRRAAIEEGIGAGMRFAVGLSVLSGLVLIPVAYRTQAWRMVLIVWIGYASLCVFLAIVLGTLYGALSTLKRTVLGRMLLAFLMMYGLFAPAAYLAIRFFVPGASTVRLLGAVAIFCAVVSPVGLFERQRSPRGMPQ